MEIRTTKEIGQDYLLFPNDNPQFKHNGKWVRLSQVLERIEWLREQVCDCENISPHFKKCSACERINEAFKDLYKIKE